MQGIPQSDLKSHFPDHINAASNLLADSQRSAAVG
jgi:hypothetical protein